MSVVSSRSGVAIVLLTAGASRLASAGGHEVKVTAATVAAGIEVSTEDRETHMNVRHITRFTVVGSVNTAIDLSLFALFVSFLHWSVVPANVISYSTGILNSFLMNKFWTFGDRTPLCSGWTSQPLGRFRCQI